MADLEKLYFSLGLKPDWDKDLEEAKRQLAKLEAKVDRIIISDQAKQSIQNQLNELKLQATVDLRGTNSAGAFEARLENIKRRLDEIATRGRIGDPELNTLGKELDDMLSVQQKLKEAKIQESTSFDTSNTKIIESESNMMTKLAQIGEEIKSIYQRITDAIVNTSSRATDAIRTSTELIQNALNLLANTKITNRQSSGSNTTTSEEKEKLRLLNQVQEKIVEIERMQNGLKNYTYQGDVIDKKVQELEQIKSALQSVNIDNVTKDSLSGLTGQKWGAQKDAIRQAKEEQKKLNQEKERTAKLASQEAEAEGKVLTATIKRKNATDELRGEMNRISHEMESQSQIATELRSIFMQMVSIYAAKNFVESVIKVGGEFQKQHIALQSIVGDMHEADTIFSQLKSLAVQSPFQFKDLASFAKQLSAFSIPTDEIYDTTKRLADISAGLGVDMGRIILAYGQVRSAAVLRGQELRQFTEAGIPMVDALAKKFGELEGRVVSAGEVFDKVTRKQVSFDMVKQVLFEMTEEGGRFYNMQETLADTLAGKWSNLTDSYQIMLSEIADGNDGVLRTGIEGITTLMQNWENVFAVIKGGIVTYATAKSVITAVNVVLALQTVLQKGCAAAISKTNMEMMLAEAAQGKMMKQQILLTRSFSKLGLAIKSIGLMGWASIAVAAIAGVVVAINSWTTEQEKLNKELDKIGDKHASSVLHESASYKDLVNQLKDATEGSEKYNKIKKRIIDGYGQYLEGIDAESMSYEKLKDSIESVTDAIIRKHNTEKFQEESSAIQGAYEQQFKDVSNNMVELLDGTFGKDSKIVVEKILSMITSGIGSTDIINRLKDAYDLPEDVLQFGKTEASSITGLSFERDGERLKNFIDLYVRLNKEMSDAIQNRYDLMNGKHGVLPKGYYDTESQYDALIGDAANGEERARLELEKLVKLKGVLEWYKNEDGTLRYKKEIEDLDKKINKSSDDTAIWVKHVKELQNALAQISGLSLDIDLNIKDGEQYFDFLRRTGQSYTEIKQQLENEIAQIVSGNTDVAWEDRASEIEKRRKALAELDSYFQSNNIDAVTNKGNKKTSGSNRDLMAEIFRNRVKVLKEAWTEYSKLVKMVGQTEANNKLRENPLFADLFGNGNFNGFSNEQGFRETIKSMIDEAEKMLSEKNTKERGNNRMDLYKTLFGIDQNILKEEIDSDFDKIEQALKDKQNQWTRFTNLRTKAGSDVASMLIFGGQTPDFTKMMKDFFNSSTGYNYETILASGTENLPDRVQKLFESVRDSIRNYSESEQNELDNLVTKWQSTSDEINLIASNLKLELERISNSGLSEEQKSALSNKATSSAELEIVKKSSGYYNLLNNVLSLTKDEAYKSADAIRSKLNTAFEQGAINAEEYTEAIAKIQDALSKLDDESSKSGILYFLTTDKATRLNDKLNKARQELSAADKEYESARDAYNSVPQNMRNYENPMWDAIAKRFVNATERRNNADSNVQSLTKRLSKENKLNDALSDTVDLLGKFSKGLDMIAEMIDSFGGDSSMLTDASTLLNGVSNGISQGLQIGGIYGAAAGAVIGGITSLNKIHDSKLQRDIEKSQLAVKNLTYEYQKLADVIENQLGSVTQHQAEQQLANLEAQRSELERQYKDEEEKKKTDKAALIDYQENIDELTNKIDNFYKTLAKDQYSVDIKGWADSLASAIVGAFKEGTDAAVAFDNEVKNIISGMVEDIVSMNILQPAMENLKKYLFGDNGIATLNSESGTDITEEEAIGLYKEISVLKDKIKDAQKVYETVSEAVGGLGEESNSSLSASIQNITEDTADLLASYLNAVRADVSIIRSNDSVLFDSVKEYYEVLAPNMNVISQNQLQEMKNISAYTLRTAEATESMNDLLIQVSNGVRTLRVS